MNGTGVGTVQVADELIADAGGFEQLGQCDIVIVGGLHTLGAHLGEIQFGIHQVGGGTHTFQECRILGFEILLRKCERSVDRLHLVGIVVHLVVEFFDQYCNVLAGFHFQHFHLLDRLFCRRIFVFAVQAVENLEINADTYCPAGHYFSYLVVVERGSAHRRDLRQEIGPLQPNSFLGQLALEGYLAEQRIELGRQVFVIGYVFQVAEYEHRRYGHTGKMGYAIAENCMRRGAEVTLITGPVAITPPPFVKVVPVVSAADMAAAVKETAEQQDIIIKAAAVADYRPDHPVDEKVKKKDGDATLTMERTEDILSYLGAHKKPGQFLCGFSMETEHMLENSRAKLAKKNADMIVANNLKVAGAGFGTDTNVVTLITADDCRELEIMSKADVASAIVSEILKKMC